MTVFVSDVVTVRKLRWRFLFADGGDAELHDFARKIGVSRDRFRGPHEKVPSRKAQWPHYRVSDALAGEAFRAGARKADRIKLVECSAGKRAAARLAKNLAHGDAA